MEAFPGEEAEAAAQRCGRFPGLIRDIGLTCAPIPFQQSLGLYMHDNSQSQRP